MVLHSLRFRPATVSAHVARPHTGGETRWQDQRPGQLAKRQYWPLEGTRRGARVRAAVGKMFAACSPARRVELRRARTGVRLRALDVRRVVEQRESAFVVEHALSWSWIQEIEAVLNRDNVAWNGVASLGEVRGDMDSGRGEEAVAVVVAGNVRDAVEPPR